MYTLMESLDLFTALIFTSVSKLYAVSQEKNTMTLGEEGGKYYCLRIR